MRHAVAAILTLTSIQTLASEPRVMPREEVPAGLSAAVARGEAAVDAFRERLFARLNALILEGGPVHAIQVCRADAPAIAREVGETHRVQIGRTSHRLRNPANAPRAWAAAYVHAAAGKKAVEVRTGVVDLGDRIGLLRPIGVMPACTRCHGELDGIDADVRSELARIYPGDRATRFRPGELRGFIWVEAPKR